ncbi:MAG: type II toxin-antitoxin system VapC family toxin [Thermomicrobiales bacterium]
MIVDTSVMISILLEEPGWNDLLQFLSRTGSSSISTANLFEIYLVLHGRRHDHDADRVMDLLDAVNLRPEPVTLDHVMIAREAFRRYGKGIDAKAKLNYGDCFAYALAKATGEPLLFVGDDFTHTDIVPALTT